MPILAEDEQEKNRGRRVGESANRVEQSNATQSDQKARAEMRSTAESNSSDTRLLDDGELDEWCNELRHDSKLLDRVTEAMQRRGYVGDVRPPLIAYVALTSRLLARPLNLAFVAPSAAGKNAAVESALELVPREAFYSFSAASPRALIYATQSFRHLIVVFLEADSIPEVGPAASAIRSIASDNRLVYQTVEKRDGRSETRIIEKEGPTGLMTTSTVSLGLQMSTRTLEITISDDADQTREVMRAQARRANTARSPSSTPGSSCPPARTAPW